jgi:hypothetical protein
MRGQIAMKPLLLGSVLLTCSDGKSQRRKKRPESPASEKENKQSNRRLRPKEKANQGQGEEPKLSLVINPNLEPAA